LRWLAAARGHLGALGPAFCCSASKAAEYGAQFDADCAYASHMASQPLGAAAVFYVSTPVYAAVFIRAIVHIGKTIIKKVSQCGKIGHKH
jgi:hypothetical protein